MKKVRAILFGSTGMIGHGVLTECLESDDVESVVVVNRNQVAPRHEKIREFIVPEIFALPEEGFSQSDELKEEIAKANACFFCLGISSAGISEKAYRRITYDLTVSLARYLVQINPKITFCYISGAGTDSSEKGKVMWARVKGETENACLKAGFQQAYMFRPALIQPKKGARSKTFSYRMMYLMFQPLFFILRRLRRWVTDTVVLGRAMIHVAVAGYEKPVIENADINKLGG